MNQLKILFVVFLALAAATLFGCGDSPSPENAVNARPVVVQPLAPSGGKEQKAFNGVIQPSKAADISFRIPGTVEAVSVIVGEEVKAEQELARLDPHDYQVVVVELEAKLEQARAAANFAQAEYDRIKQASKNQAIAQVNLERAASGLAQSQATLKVVEQNLEKARDAVRYTVLKAPFDGLVGKVDIEDFEQILPAVPVIELHNPYMLEAVTDVPENQLPRFEKGMKAAIKWYGSTEEHPATVSEISTVAHPVKQTYDVIFSFDEQTRGLLPGKSVTVNVSLATSQGDEFCVPLSAVLQQGDDSFVYLTSEEDKKVTKHQVKVQRIADNGLCITGTLKPDQLIVTAGVHYLSDGQEVGQLLKNE